ncbi:MAG TPA: hypothetical protein VGE61_06545 [Glycomyces sp.]
MIDAIRSLLTVIDPGFASASDAEVVFAVAVGSMLAWIALKFVADIARDAAKFAKGQVDQRFWREPGKVRIVIGVVLLAVAYGYGADQPRPLGEALLDLGRGQFLAVMPIAILTQWLLLIMFWLLFGRIAGVPLKELAKPIGTVASGTVVIAVELAPFTLGALALIGGDTAIAAAGFGAMFALNLALALLTAARERRKPPEARDTRFWVRNPVALALLLTVLLSVLFVLVAVLVALGYAVYAYFSGAGPAALTPASVIRGEVIAVSVVFLVSCFRFRSDSLAEVDAPPAVLHFADLSLALSAGLVAATAVAGSPVVLGAVPPWLIAVGPPLTVAAMVFGIYLVRMRDATPRWGVCLVVSVAAAFLVLPATKGVTALLALFLPNLTAPF